MRTLDDIRIQLADLVRGHPGAAAARGDFAIVAERAPGEIAKLSSLLREHRPILAERIENRRVILQEEYDALDLLDSRKSLDDCISALCGALERL